jgi:excisionase family DNA binding protein
MNKSHRKRKASQFAGEDGATSHDEARLPTSYTPLQLAKALQCSRQTITRACQNGTIVGVKVGALWRIPYPEGQRLLGLSVAAVE